MRRGLAYLGGVGMMRTVTGTVTLERLTAVLPGAGGDTMVKDTSPLAMSSTELASGSTRMKRARKPDQGHSTLLYSNFTLRYWPATLLLLKTGGPSNCPAEKHDVIDEDLCYTVVFVSMIVSFCLWMLRESLCRSFHMWRKVTAGCSEFSVQKMHSTMHAMTFATHTSCCLR